MGAIEQLNQILSNSDYGFTIINGGLGIEIEQYTPHGYRTIRGRFQDALNEDGVPEFATVSARYDGNNVERWNLSKAEMMYLLQQVRIDLFSQYLRAGDIIRNMMSIGQYFTIEGHFNFLKHVWSDDEDHFAIRCGTGNSTYERTYVGLFYNVDNHVFCLGHYFEEDISKDIAMKRIKTHNLKPKLILCFKYHPNAKFYYQYR
jgi:hypothetical protein